MISPTPMTAAPAFSLDYFDGSSGKPMPCHIWFEGQGNARKLVIQLDADDLAFTPVLLRLDAHRITWPEATSSPHRQVPLPTGASLSTAEGAALDVWLAHQGVRKSWVAQWQERWHWALTSLALLVAFVAAGYQWGVPWAATALLTIIPSSVDEQVGESALEFYDAQMLEPSQLDPATQERIRKDFANVYDAAFAQAGRPSDWPAYTLHFRAWDGGPNAFALPGGTMVMTDALVEMADDDHEMVSGVLAHEYGHVLHRHSMHNLVRVSLLSVASAVLFGDVNSVLSSAPLLLGQMHYSRQFERQADTVAADMLIAAKQSPMALARFFQEMSSDNDAHENDEEKSNENDSNDAGSDVKNHPRNGQTPSKTGLNEDSIGIAISSHPSDGERIAYFERRAQAAGFQP